MSIVFDKGLIMFLNRLNEDEKRAFLKLVHYIARVDGDFSNKQKEIIATYCIEMQINDIEFDVNSFELNDTLTKFENIESQRIILLEVMALVFSDNILHPEEKKVLDTMIEVFNLNSSLIDVYAEWTKAILAITAQAQALLKL